jgi:prepilin-type N-terminal cleavage/methylation domain-containing protein
MSNLLQHHRRRHGFTLVELLVVIFIIALLSTLILAAVHMAQRSSRISRTKLGLAAISSALEQYHNDFKVYPGLANGAGPIRYTILAQALIGPGPATEDGADGPGFRTVTDPASGKFDPNAKKWDAYLSPEKFKVQAFTRPTTPGINYWALLDGFDNPIRYFPKRKSLNPKVPSPQGTLVDDKGNCMFDLRDGEHPQLGTYEIDAPTFEVIIGDDNNNNAIDGNESLLVEGNFILATPGPNGQFTIYAANENSGARRQKMTKSDDIFNFER